MPTPEEEQFQQLLEKAKAGDNQAMFNLSAAYHEGKNTKKDQQQCFYWTEKAAEARNLLPFKLKMLLKVIIPNFLAKNYNSCKPSYCS